MQPWGGTLNYGISQDKGNCFDPRGSDLALADNERKAFTVIGGIVSRYDEYSVIESKPLVCEFPGLLGSHNQVGQAFIVGEHAVIWQPSLTKVWGTLPYESIEEVRPVEKHLLGRWMIPIKRRDGSCMFVSVSKYGKASKDLQEEARSEMLTRLGAVK
jgi:hypothetical protein